MAVQLGGKVEWSDTREFGYAEVRARGHTRLFDGIEDFRTAEGHGMLKVWMSHGDKVTELPPGFKLMASTPSCPIAGMADVQRHFYAVQFHPEVTHTVQGKALLERFVLDICGTRPDWIMRDHIEEAVALIRQQVGNEEVILGLSGGVDSSVVAAIVLWTGAITAVDWLLLALWPHLLIELLLVLLFLLHVLVSLLLCFWPFAVAFVVAAVPIIQKMVNNKMKLKNMKKA